MTTYSARRYGFPLPQGSDPIRGGDDAIRQLSTQTAMALDNLTSAINSAPAAQAAAAADAAAADALAALELARAVALPAVEPADGAVATLLQSPASETYDVATRTFVRVTDRPVALTSYLPTGIATTDDATPYLRQALADAAGELEWRDGLVLTLTGRIVIPDGKTLRIGAGGRAEFADAGGGFDVYGHLIGGTVSVRGAGLQDVAVWVRGGAVSATATAVTTTGGGSGFAVGGATDTVTTPTAATRATLTSCTATGAAQWPYRLDRADETQLIACTGVGGLDVIKLREQTRRTRIVAGSYTGATAGDGIDGFAGGEETYIGGGAIFAENKHNGLAFKSDDDATGDQLDIAAYRADHGRPRRLILDGVLALNNEGSGLTVHRTDETDSDVAAGKLLPRMLHVQLSNIISAGNGRGFNFNAEGLYGSALYAIDNTTNGFVTHKNARDVTLVGTLAYGNGTPTGIGDGYVLDGQRIKLIAPTARGISLDAVSDADYDAIPKDERSTRFGFRVVPGADVWMMQPSARWCRTAPLSDSDGRTTLLGHDLRDATTGAPVYPQGQLLAPGSVVAHRAGASVARAIWQAANGALVLGDNGANGYLELILGVRPGGAITATGDIRPQTNGGAALGQRSFRWSSAWIGSHALRVNAGRLEISTDGTNWTAPTL